MIMLDVVKHPRRLGFCFLYKEKKKKKRSQSMERAYPLPSFKRHFFFPNGSLAPYA